MLTARLLLVPFAPASAEPLHRIFTAPAVRRFLLDDAEVSLGWVRAEITASQARFDGGSLGLWAVHRHDEPSLPIGFVGFRPFPTAAGEELQLLFGLLPEAWGRGYATEAARAAVVLARAHGATELIAAADAPNTASLRVLARLGFRPLGEAGTQEPGTPLRFRLGSSARELDEAPGGLSLVDRSTVPARLYLPPRYNAAVDLIERNLLAGRGDKPAFIDDTSVLTYAGLAERTNRAGNLLRALGVQPEQRVLLLLQDTTRFPVMFLGALKIGAVPVPLNTLLSAADYGEILRDSRARVLVVSAPLWGRIAAEITGPGAPPSLQHVIIDGDGGGDGGGDGVSGGASDGDGAPPGERLEPRLLRHSPVLTAAPTTPDDAGFWLYTSGSTGRLKAAVHAQSDLVHTAEHYAVGVLGLGPDDVVFSAAKLFFAYGLGNALTFPLYVGATAILMAERPTPASIGQRQRAHAPTVFFGVPTLYASLLADPALGTGGRLRACVSAGEALPAEVGRRFTERTGAPILDGIGSTEMLHIFLSNRPGDVCYGTTGRPVPGYEVKLLDEAGAEVGPGVIGDLWVCGPSSATHYFGRRELSQRTFCGRWTRTGDLYLRDVEGRYVYQGRSDDMLKVGGQYVSPFEVESALTAHPAVLEAAVVAQCDEHGLVKPRAFVVLTVGVAAGEGLLAELKAHVKGLLAPHKYPRWIDVVSELPKTATGKIQRFRLRSR